MIPQRFTAPCVPFPVVIAVISAYLDHVCQVHVFAKQPHDKLKLLVDRTSGNLDLHKVWHFFWYSGEGYRLCIHHCMEFSNFACRDCLGECLFRNFRVIVFGHGDAPPEYSVKLV
jgi:hypothetical protein